MVKKKAVRRSTVNDSAQTSVLTKSRRRCCLCFWLMGEDEMMKGQIAHLDHDSSNSEESNLCFLCFNHHDEYDSSTRQSKGLRESEVRHWRDELYREMAYRFREHTAENQRNKETFEHLESIAGDFLKALRMDLSINPLTRLICISDPIAKWSGPRSMFVYRTNRFEKLLDKADVLHNQGLLRHDEGPMFWITENFATYLRNSYRP
jgi:hypothetical protein